MPPTNQRTTVGSTPVRQGRAFAMIGRDAVEADNAGDLPRVRSQFDKPMALRAE